MKTSLRLATKEELPALARLFVKAFFDADPGRPWHFEQAFPLMEYYFKLQPDLFLVAEVDGLVVGATTTIIKPWRHGNRGHDGLWFVDPAHQGKGIGQQLFRKKIELAKEKYNIESYELVTFADDLPLRERFESYGFSLDEKAVFMKGRVDDILAKIL